ncbi:hypothetical protein PTSG_05796 [Salpingoeca rosetta]|uniref:Uncharacterized protein n=1 Tax=Salpingoeca rosetta (strain ATCC 50818 / BSB-021) TaxID=946362 RepID=F2UCT6_SALR5|nr:uncharacterized protein PTSG_05796 [Salpingoeca rosetta]EGD74431.1 hypothetical protein PTSG_05796 [Salpingoeca rosetta]|eukprot:XP_004992688.1 hypothetical protein PTSG_05796 [Salpingoeca rosetta]
MLMEAGSHAGCCCCNSPDSAAVAVLMQCSHMRARGRLPEDRWRMMGGAHMMEWEEQLWIHTSMVMVGTSNHSDAVSSAATVITIAIDRTAAITLRPTPAPIWREADNAHVTRSDEEARRAGWLAAAGGCCDDGRACACALCAVFGAAPVKTRKDTARAHRSSPFISSFCSISDDDGGRGMCAINHADSDTMHEADALIDDEAKEEEEGKQGHKTWGSQ